MTEKADPKLRALVKQIEQLCINADVGATISLVSPTHGEFLIHFPTWSGVQESDDKAGFRIKMSMADEKKAGATAHLVVSHMEINSIFIEAHMSILEEMKKHADISFTDVKTRITREKDL